MDLEELYYSSLQQALKEVDRIKTNSRDFSAFAKGSTDERLMTGIIAELDRVVQLLSIVAVILIKEHARDSDD